MSFSMAVTTFVGQNYGAGKIDRVKKGMWTTIGMGMIYTVVTGALILLFSNEIMRLFTEDKDVIAYGRMAIMFFCPFYFILSILQSLAGTVRGTGKSVPPMVVLLVSMCLFRIVWVQFILPMFNSIDGIFILYPVSWALGPTLPAFVSKNVLNFLVENYNISPISTPEEDLKKILLHYRHHYIVPYP